jgi:hypothetical protein
MTDVRQALEEQVQACRAFVTDALPDYIHVTTMPLVYTRSIDITSVACCHYHPVCEFVRHDVRVTKLGNPARWSHPHMSEVATLNNLDTPVT